MPHSRSRARRALGGGLGLIATIGLVTACNGWSPLDPFQHHSPDVDKALVSFDAGRFQNAESILERYLKTGSCSEKGLGLNDETRNKVEGSFDLGLSLFKLAEKFGKRFGDEESFDEAPEDKEGRLVDIGCAFAIADAIAHDPKVTPELRARASYLAGNLKFLNREYAQAIKSYDETLMIVPGLADDAGVDGVGRDAAHNRAIALRRLHEQEADGGFKEDPDGNMLGQPQQGDGGEGDDDQADSGKGDQDGGADGGKGDEDQDDKGNGAGDAGKDAGPDGASGGGDDAEDAGADDDDGKQDAGAAPVQPKPQAPQQQGAQQDDRMLDRLEEAPSYQQQEARMRGNRHRRRMEDK